MTSITDQRTDIRRTEDAPNGTPWWIVVIYKYGIWAAMACYLVYNLSTTQAATLNRIDGNVSTHAATSVVAVQDEKERGTRMEAYLRLLCVNTAKTVSAINTCLSVR